MRTPESKLVWLAYLSVALAYIWGTGLPLALYVRKRLRVLKQASPTPSPKQKRDSTGASVLSWIGIVLNAVVILAILYSWVTTYLF